VPPYVIGGDECVVCRSWREPAQFYCNTCTIAAQTLRVLVPVIPISLYCKPSLLRDLLTYYKPGRDQFIPGYRDALSFVVREFMGEMQPKLWRFLSGWTDIVVVPSTRNEGRHPLNSIVEAAGLNTRKGCFIQ
jgi:hypothetical protein